LCGKSQLLNRFRDQGGQMFFSVSKILQSLTRPGDLLLYILFAGVLFSWFSRTRRFGIVLTTLAAAGFAVVIIPTTGAKVTAPLERRFPRPASLPGRVDGIIVLGGAIEPYATITRGTPALTADAERMTEFVRLAKIYPAARLVFSGGSGLLDVDWKYTEAKAASLFFEQQGLDVRRITFEDKSRNTFENVQNSKALVKPRQGEVWLLVQSAIAVPRSVGIFSKVGWPVIPVPVAYKSDNDFNMHLSDDLAAVDRAAHEWTGLIVYWLTGKTDTLFPSPANP
jgi:uncharacterized SAM-binding protein YcdF (DUF218 family)